MGAFFFRPGEFGVLVFLGLSGWIPSRWEAAWRLCERRLAALRLLFGRGVAPSYAGTR